MSRKDKGKLKTQVDIIIRDSSKTEMTEYAFNFLSPNRYELINLTTDEVVAPTPRTYISNRVYNLNAGLAVNLSDTTSNIEFLPKEGDVISIRFAVNVVRNNTDTVVDTRRFVIDQDQSTSDGVLFSMSKPDIISDVSRIGGTDYLDIIFSVADEAQIIDNMYIVSTEGSGIGNGNNPFISLLVKDDSLNTVAQFDSVYNFDTFEFNGVRGSVEFNVQSPPSPGNIFSVTTIVPIPPNLQDGFMFDIIGSSVNNAAVKNNISKIKVVPNPYIVSSLYEPEFGELRREPLRQIQFINLPNVCTIHIFTVDADKVKTLYHDSNSGTEIWDLRSEGGREIAPGIYIYVVKAEGTEYLNRFAVIK